MDELHRKETGEVSLTIAEAAERLGVSKKTIARRIKSGNIEAFKYGDGKTSPIRIPEESLQAYIVKCKTAT